MTGRVAAPWRSLRGLVCHVVDLVIAVLFLLVGLENVAMGIQTEGFGK